MTEAELEYIPQEKDSNEDQAEGNGGYVPKAEASSNDPEECVIDGKLIWEKECRSIMNEKYDKQGFFSRLIDWFISLF